jgi:hypothetical protein
VAISQGDPRRHKEMTRVLEAKRLLVLEVLLLSIIVICNASQRKKGKPLAKVTETS